MAPPLPSPDFFATRQFLDTRVYHGHSLSTLKLLLFPKVALRSKNFVQRSFGLEVLEVLCSQYQFAFYILLIVVSEWIIFFQASSSALAAGFLEASGGGVQGFIGFGGVSGNLGYVPASVTGDDENASDADFHLVLRKLTKRDATTKLKVCCWRMV